MAKLDESLLTGLPPFARLSRPEIREILDQAHARRHDEGAAIFREGEEGVGFFLITRGKVDIKRGDTGIAEIGNGGFFGEMALLDNHRRSATVTAIADTDCLAIMRSDFLAELRNNPDLAVEMLGVMSRRVRDLDEKLSHS